MPDHRFLANGRERASEGAAVSLAELKERVQQRVAAEYADRLARAGRFERLRLRAVIAWRVRQEFNREREKLAPKGGLYFSNG